MSGVETVEVAADEADLRLDRWFRRRYPHLSHARLEKLLRTGQVRVDGGRVKAGQRLAPGQRVRVPPLGPAPEKAGPPPVSAADAKALRARVLYRDDEIIVIDKPPGLAVQGGTKTRRHLDAMLDALHAGGERPRLVHRLDRDTSGVLVLARSAAAAARLAKAFRGREVRKLYWALVAGRPKPDEGRIDLPLAKRGRPGGERVAPDEAEGKRAVTRYRVIDTVGGRAAWLALEPLTGRTHQLRAHCAAIGAPIVGDGKYGGRAAFIPGEAIAKALHLHARTLLLPRPGGGSLRITAPLPGHMRETWRLFGFDADADVDPFADDDR